MQSILSKKFRFLSTELLTLLTEYFDSMSPLIIDTDGSVLDYIGDAVLACWNAPQDVSAHGYRCVKQSLEMHKRLEVLRIRWKAKGYLPVHIRCGIHTASVYVGNIGGTSYSLAHPLTRPLTHPLTHTPTRTPKVREE